MVQIQDFHATDIHYTLQFIYILQSSITLLHYSYKTLYIVSYL